MDITHTDLFIHQSWGRRAARARGNDRNRWSLRKSSTGKCVISVLKGYALLWICGALLNNSSFLLQYLFITALAHRWPKIIYLTLF
jgi:hypothetical protein